MLRRNQWLSLLVVSTVLALAVPSDADDFNPPPWDRDDPFATSAEWDFVTPPTDENQNDFFGDDGWEPDGSEVPLNTGNSGAPTQILYQGDIRWDGENALEADPTGDGGVIIIEFDNIVDDEPLKKLRIRITGVNPLDAENPIPNDGVTVEAADQDAPVVTAERISSGFVQDEEGGFSWGQDWELRPNPDFEVINLPIEPGVIIEQIVADAISIPEPATVAMLLPAGLLMLHRKRR